MNETRWSARPMAVVSVVVVLTMAFAMVACVPPIPLAKRTKTTAGVDLKIDVQAIKPGVSTREQVRAMLSSTLIEESPDRYWARYFESRSSNPGGYRDWGAKNLFITFDGHGVVEKVHQVGDHQLAGELSTWRAPVTNTTGTAKLEAPVYILRSWVYHKAEVTITDDGVDVVDHDVTPEYSAKLPNANLKKVNATASYGVIPVNVFLKLTIDGIEGERRTLQAELTPQQLREWISFLRKNYPNAKYE